MESLSFGWRMIPRVLQTIAWFPAWFALVLFARFTVRGREHLRGLSHAIFAVNHNNEADPIILTAAVGPFSRLTPMFYIMIPHAEVRNSYTRWHEYIYQKPFFHAWGSYALVRGLRDYGQSLHTHTAILNRGGSLCVFPEGGITRSDELREFKGGMIYLAQETNTPIVPVAITGSRDLTWSSFLKGSHRVTLEFAAPIDSTTFKELSTDEYRGAATQVRAKVNQMLKHTEVKT